MWDKGWDKLFSEVEWGRYPSEELIRFIARNFYESARRSEIKILEVGCGTGANIWFFSREGFSAYGIDGSKVAIKKAKIFLKSENLTADLIVGDAMDLPYPDSYFDAVVDVECIYANSLTDTGMILEEIYRVLKNEGIFFSKTFGDEMSGKETGIRHDQEPNTFLSMPDGPLRDDYGLIRLTSEEEIRTIYSLFSDIKYDYVYRTDADRLNIVPEWIIQARKKLT